MRVSWKAIQIGPCGKGMFEDIYLATSFFQERPSDLSAIQFANTIHAALATMYERDPNAVVIVSCSVGMVDRNNLAAQASRMADPPKEETPLFKKWDSDVEIDLSKE